MKTFPVHYKGKNTITYCTYTNMIYTRINVISNCLNEENYPLDKS